MSFQAIAFTNGKIIIRAHAAGALRDAIGTGRASDWQVLRWLQGQELRQSSRFKVSAYFRVRPDSITIYEEYQ